MKYVLIGYKLDEDEHRTEIYEIDVLDYSEDEIIITDEDKEIYHRYDVLKVYKEY